MNSKRNHVKVENLFSFFKREEFFRYLKSEDVDTASFNFNFREDYEDIIRSYRTYLKTLTEDVTFFNELKENFIGYWNSGVGSSLEHALKSMNLEFADIGETYASVFIENIGKINTISLKTNVDSVLKGVDKKIIIYEKAYRSGLNTEEIKLNLNRLVENIMKLNNMIDVVSISEIVA